MYCRRIGLKSWHRSWKPWVEGCPRSHWIYSSCWFFFFHLCTIILKIIAGIAQYGRIPPTCCVPSFFFSCFAVSRAEMLYCTRGGGSFMFRLAHSGLLCCPTWRGEIETAHGACIWHLQVVFFFFFISLLWNWIRKCSVLVRLLSEGCSPLYLPPNCDPHPNLKLESRPRLNLSTAGYALFSSLLVNTAEVDPIKVPLFFISSVTLGLLSACTDAKSKHGKLAKNTSLLRESDQ